MKFLYNLIPSILFLAAYSCGQQEAVNVEQDPRYHSVCWVQNSAEYKFLTTQTYRLAKSQMLVALDDPKWSADEIQVTEGGYEQKPPAVILDVDETVLDNSAYNARNITKGRDYTTESWNAWCNEEKATAIPGAVEFIRAAQGLGVEVIFVTQSSR